MNEAKHEHLETETGYRRPVFAKENFFLLFFFVCSATSAYPQPERLHQALLDATNGFTLMSVAAHPDDEDIEAVTYYRKKLGARAVVIVASRGEGGQNEIGPELYADLGVVRSEEMRRAEAISGGEYFNLNFVDFGFSKHVDETYHKWGRGEIRRRLVRMIRLLKPQVIITNHDSTSGHGNHQAVERELVWAFRAAADPKQFPEQISAGLVVWQPSRLFWHVSERAARGPVGDFLPWLGNTLARDLPATKSPTPIQSDTALTMISLPVGEYSARLGKTYARHAAEALSQHRSQGMDFFAARIPDGPRWRYYRLIAATPADAAAADPGSRYAQDLFSGLASAWDTTPGLSQKIQAVLYDLSQQTQSESLDRQTILELARQLEDELNKRKTPIVDHLAGRAQELLAAALGVEFGISVSKKILVTGQQTELAWSWKWEGFGGPTPTSGRPRLMQVFGLGYRIHIGDAIVATSDEARQLPDDATRIHFSGSPRLAESQPVTRPLTKIIYKAARLPEPVWGESFFTYRGVKFTLRRVGLAAAGIPEIAAPMEVEEPRLPIIVTPADAGKNVRVPVQIKNHLKSSQIAQVILKQDDQIVTKTQAVVREDTLVHLDLPISAKLPVAPWKVDVEIQTVLLQNPMVISYEVVPVIMTVPAVRVGLIKSYDTTIDWTLRAVNLPFVEITDADLAAGAFHDLQTIIVDMRAYLARPALRANNVKLLEWIKAGGHAVVMYHKTFEWNPPANLQGQTVGAATENTLNENKYFPPYLLHLGFERVTDETAAVTMLDPQAQIWHFPNQITAVDWQGWVQERGLYFPRRWDAHFQPLVRVADPDDAALEGGMLLADCGKGSYLYTSLVWYRQLRAGVPGAFRLFMNMLVASLVSRP